MKAVGNGTPAAAGRPKFTEIERKFLPAHDGWRALPATRLHIRQGYLCLDPERTVRVRLCEGRAFLTVKGKNRGAARAEFDFPIPEQDGLLLLERLALRPFVEKIRRRIELGALVWEVDEFAGENSGLVLIEVELEDENAPLVLPDWVGREVTGDPRWANSALVREPFSRRRA
ncbi:MAG: CYTH domain-containing protein [Desulfovibrio sp.]|nr:CYTH domain-containing protein [Desulfovibrio sp.]